MDFELEVDGQTIRFEQFSDLVGAITEKIAVWNNFASDKPLKMQIRKVPSGTDTLGIHVEDEYNIRDLFGQS